jgi:hypothetical protein
MFTNPVKAASIGVGKEKLNKLRRVFDEMLKERVLLKVGPSGPKSIS